MRILFLDIDGVLNSVGYFLKDYENRLNWFRGGNTPGIETRAKANFDPANVKNLDYILKHIPDLKIVISSAWRHTYHYELIGKMIQLNSLEFNNEKVIDRTSIGPTREYEIRTWINLYKPDNWFCLDDNWVFDSKEKNFLKTEPYNGLTFYDSVKVIQHFYPHFKHPEILL